MEDIEQTPQQRAAMMASLEEPESGNKYRLSIYIESNITADTEDEAREIFKSEIADTNQIMEQDIEIERAD